MADSGLLPVLRHAVRYTAASYAVQLITLALALVVKRWLGPASVGVWASLMLLTTYLNLAQLRIVDAAQKEIGFRRGKGDEASATLIRDVMFTAWLGVATLLGAGTVAAAWLVPSLRSPDYRFGLLLVGAIYPVTQLLACYTVMFRAHQRFTLLGRTMLVVALANLALQLPLTYWLSLRGLALAYVLANLFHLGYWLLAARDPGATTFRPRWHWPTLRRLLEVGIPMQVAGLVTTLFRSLDQLLLLGRLGPAALGLYSIGTSVNTFVYGIPNAVSVVTFPSFQERYGRHESRAALLDLLVTPVRALALVVLPLAVGGAYLALPALVHAVLPQFAGGLRAAQVLLLGTFALSLNHMPGQFLITVDRQGPGIAVAAAATALLAGGCWLALGRGLGLVGVAAATAVAYAASSAAMLLLAVTMAGSFRRGAALLGECALALTWTWGAVAACEHLVPGPVPAAGWAEVATAAVRIPLFLLLAAPLALLCERRTGLIGELLRSRRRRS